MVQRGNLSVANPFIPKSTEDVRVTSSETMMPRRLTQCVKVSAVILAITIIFLIITGLKAGNRWSNIINYNKQLSPIVESSHESYNIGHVVYDRKTNSITFNDMNVDQKHANYLNIKLNRPETESAINLKSSKIKSYSECVKAADDNKEPVLCLEFSNGFIAVINVEKFNDTTTSCHVLQFQWSSHGHGENATKAVEQCIDLNENWYGGGALSEHRWPLNRVNVPMQPYITRKFDHDDKMNVYFESFLEPYFVSASGVALLLDAFLPLFISINHNNNKKICFRAVFDKPYSFPETSSQTLLKYRVCKGNSARSIHEHLLKTQILDHSSEPNVDVLKKSVWSTRGIDLKNFNENQLLKYISSLKKNDLPYSLLFIDGNYSRSAGSVYFNEKKFPHSAQLTMELDNNHPHKKLKVGTEIFPLIPKSMSVKNFSFSNTKILDALYLDLSNDEAVNWFLSQLDIIKEQIGVKGFRFSGGHAASPLHNIERISDLRMKKSLHPNEITHNYGKIAGRFKGYSFLGSGFKSQRHGLVADAGPFLATWDHHKGLKSIIPTVITYGIIGYPFVSVGPVGGVNLHLNLTTGHFSLSDRNLYLRWMQLSSFLPVMEFSVGPWQYDVQVLNYTRSLLTFRQNELWPEFLSPAIKEASTTGIPIIRPLWWIAPFDKTAQFIDCEFMLGNNLLVAPVLDFNRRGRQIYLPLGSMWQDQLRNGKIHKGGQWLSNYHVDEFEIAHFIRIPSFSKKSDKE